MLKRKAFTLVELLAVVVILGVVLAIAVPTIMNYIESTRKNAYTVQKEMIARAAEKYLVQYEQNVSWDNDVAGILLSELQAVDLLSDPLDDTKGGYFAGETRIMVTRTDATMGFEVTTPEELAYQFGKSMLDGVMPAGNAYLHKNGSNRFVGPDPHNWLQFGTVNGQPILWRIIRYDNEGIKIIYEGPVGSITGRITIDGSTGTPWDTSNSNKWERPATLKAKLQNWYNNELTITDRYEYIEIINWCLGASGQGINYATEYVPTEHYLQTECIDGNYSGGSFLGTTDDKVGIGLIQVSNYLSASNAETCVGSYWNGGESSAFNEQGRHCGRIVNEAGRTNYLWKSYHWWTFTVRATNSTNVWNVDSSGSVANTSSSNESRSVRPVLNLQSDILYGGGNGTLGNPYTIQ